MTEQLRRELEALARGLEAALGAELVSLLIYGSAARGSEVEGSNVNLLMILRDASPDVLRRAGPLLAGWARQGRLPPLIHSEAEWRAAADVFPVEMDDIREAHILLAGADPTIGVTTRPDDVRRELERETRGVLTRLRAAYAALGGEGPSTEEFLKSAMGTVLVLLRAALRLAGRPVPADAASVAREAAAVCGLQAAAFEWPLAARAGRAPAKLAAFDPAATSFVEAVEQFSHWLDQHQPGGES